MADIEDLQVSFDVAETTCLWLSACTWDLFSLWQEFLSYDHEIIEYVLNS